MFYVFVTQQIAHMPRDTALRNDNTATLSKLQHDTSQSRCTVILEVTNH